MKTIRSKLILLFSLFMLALVASGILLNALFLEKYYIYSNRSIFEKISQEIEKVYRDEPKGLMPLIESIDRMEGISTTIADKDLIIRFNSFATIANNNPDRLPLEIEELIRINGKVLRTAPLYVVVDQQKDQAPKLVFVTSLKTGDYMVLRKPLKGISESVTIANRFYSAAGFILVCLGGIFITFYSKRITEPIKEMSAIADKISHLSFDERIITQSDDELGRLGVSINQISQKLSVSIESLNQDVERRKALVRNITHELKTPIGVIKGYSEGLQFGVADDEEKRLRYCRIISEECDRMDDLVKSLLHISALESGYFELEKTVVDVGQLVRNSLVRFDPVIAERELKLQLDLSEQVTALVDPQLFGRVVDNFISNAIHHVAGDKEIQVSLKLEESSFRLSVFNTGSPLPEEELSHLYDVFYKVDKARTRQYGGHGLGLSIVRLIADLHGGRTGVTQRDKGIEFFVVIPQKIEL